MTPTLAVGVDIGGTNLKIALVDRAARIVAQQSVPTVASRGAESVVQEVVKLAGGLLTDRAKCWSDVAGVGVASPGPLDLRTGRIIKAANLPGWRDVPLRDMIAAASGRPAFLDNDANAAAFGEFWSRRVQANHQAEGNNHSADDLVLLTLGTGVGAGVILDGRILHGARDNAGELGHMIVVVDGLTCPCGQRGCLEQYASAAAVARQAELAMRKGEASDLAGCMQRGESLDSAAVAHAAERGDALAIRVWDQACLYLAIAIINIQHAYNPTVVLLGGGMSAAGEFLLTRVRHFLAQHQWTLCADLPEVRIAELGNDAGIIGAAGLVWDSPAGTS